METIRSEEESEPFSDELAAAMKRLWADPALNTATYSRRLEFHLHDSAKQLRFYCILRGNYICNFP
jgi:hypothetical protein